MPAQNLDDIPPVSTIVVSAPSSDPGDPKAKKPKWVFVAIAVVVLAAAGSGAVYLQGKTSPAKVPNTQPTPEPTAVATTSLNKGENWKTYTNKKFNFTIQYPGDWSANEYPTSQDGASFNPLNIPSTPDTSDAISISAGQKVGNYQDSLEQYAKVAATSEIQNYNKLASLKKIITVDGAVGYETTWMVQPMTVMGQPPTKGDSESLPITYFEIPGNKAALVRATLNRKEDLDTYEKMLTTVKVMAPLTPIPTVDEAEVLKYVMKKYVALKHKSNENSLTITVSKVEGDFAQGGVSDEGGGGMWFAAKEDGVWKLVWDGNGVIECSTFTNFPNFPTTMIPECYDEAKQDTVQR